MHSAVIDGTVDAPALIIVVEEQPACSADLSGDGTVNAIDLMQLLSCWGDVKSVACEACDFDATGAVDVTDLLALFEHWGPCDA